MRYQLIQNPNVVEFYATDVEIHRLHTTFYTLKFKDNRQRDDFIIKLFLNAFLVNDSFAFYDISDRQVRLQCDNDLITIQRYEI